MLKPFLMVPALFLIGAPAFFQQPTPATPSTAAPAQTQSAVPAEYMGKVNPVTPTPQSQARAKQIYSWDCAACHGDEGGGKGPVAVEQKFVIPDLRDVSALKQVSDGELFYYIENGKGQMPGDAARTKPDEVWNLVIYIRKMANPQAAAAVPPS
jgi:mono/diheme cytochrome c family protein